MRKLLLIFSFLSMAIAVMARQHHVPDTTFLNFTVKDGEIVWSCVYENISKEDIMKYLSTDRHFIIKDTNDSVLMGFTRAEVLPFSECGYKLSKIVHPFDDQCEISFRVDVSEERYRVVVDYVKWSNVYSVGIPAGGMIVGASGTEIHTLDDIAFKNGKFRKFFINKGAAQLNDVLTYLFTVRFPESIVPEEW